MEEQTIKDKTLWYARIFPITGTYEVVELHIRTAEDTYFVGIDPKSKQSFLFPYKALDREVFEDRNEALKLVKEAEKSGKKDFEIYYEED